MALRYVRPSLGSGGSGTTTDPYGTVAAAYTAASAGDTIFIDTTTGSYRPTNQITDSKGLIWRPWIGTQVVVDASQLSDSYVLRLEATQSDASGWCVRSVPSGKFAYRVNANIAAFADMVAEDSQGSAIAFAAGFTGTLNAYRCTFRRCSQGWRIDTMTGTLNLYSCYTYDLELYNRMNSATGKVNVYNGTFAGHTAEGWLVSTGSIDFYACLFAANGKSDSRDNIRNDGTGTVNFYTGAYAHTMLDITPFAEGFTNASSGTFTVSANVIGASGEINRMFRTPRRPEGCVSFVRDDLEDYITGGSAAGEAFSWLDSLETYGFKGTYNISTREGDSAAGSQSAAGWQDVRRIVARGHDIATQGCTGFHLANTDWITITYTGAASTFRLVKSGSRFQTYVNGTLDKNIDMSAPYKLSDLQTAMNAGNYTAALSTLAGGASDASPAAARWLADMDVTVAKNVGVLMRADPVLVFNGELLQNRTDIYNNTGYLAKSHIFSTGSYNEKLAQMMRLNGWYGGRLGANPVAGYSTKVSKFLGDWDYDPFCSFGLLCTTFLDVTSTATLKRSTKAVCEWAKWHGAHVTFYGHAYSEFSLANWAIVIQAVSESGVQVKTLTDMYSYGTNLRATNALSNSTSDDAWRAEPHVSSGIVEKGGAWSATLDVSSTRFRNPASPGAFEVLRTERRASSSRRTASRS